MAHRLYFILALILSLACLTHVTRAFQSETPSERARQVAAAAKDKSFLRAEREAALKQLQEAAQLFLSAGEKVEAARSLNRVGRLQINFDDPQAALASYNAAKNLLRQQRDEHAEVDNLTGLAAVNVYLQKLEPATSQLQEAIAQSQQLSYTAGEAQATLTLARLQNYENHALGAQTAQKALSLFQTLNDQVGIAMTYAQIGQCYLAQNLLTEAAQNYQNALQVWRELGNNSGQAGALVALGFIEFRKSGWQEAIAYHMRAQELTDEKAEPRRMGQVAMGLGEAFTESGLPEIGLDHIRTGLEYYRQTQDPFFIAFALWRLGVVHYLLGDYEAAVKHISEALREMPADSIQSAQCREYLGRVYIATHDYASARAELLQALATYRRTLNTKEAAQVQGLIGEIYEHQGQTDAARASYREALASFIELTDKVNESAVLYALGRLELRAEQYDQAEDYLRRSLDMTEKIRRGASSSDLMTAFSASVHDRYQTYIECLMRKPQSSQSPTTVIQAFEASESARGRSLAELLRATQTNLTQGVEPDLAKREKELRQDLRVKEDVKISLLAKAYKKEEVDTLVAEIAKLEGEYEQVLQQIKTQAPNYVDITRPSAWNLQQIQEGVVGDDKTLLLEYSFGRERSYVWAVSRDRIDSYELPSQDAINKAAQSVYGLLERTSGAQTDAELTRASGELSQMILSPVASHLNKERLIVVADGALNYIPFQVLPAPSSSEPLVATHEVINVPSASILGQLRVETERRGQPTEVLAAFGDPVFESNYAQSVGAASTEHIAAVQTIEGERWQHALRDIEPVGDKIDPSSLQPLFYSKLELANLHEIAGPKSFVATGFEASREKLEQADLTKYAILHFATHGILNPKRPENSGLFLSMVNREGRGQNGFIGLQDIYRLHAPVDLVVLSACRTGLGKDVRGEGLIGLTRGFMYAGASSVMASLWKVDDEATAELMKRFYANLLQHGMKPAAALRAAQNSIRQEPQWRSPHFWAAFTLQGEYSRVIELPTQSWRAAMIVGSVTLLLIVFGVWSYWRLRQSTTRR